MKDMSKISDAFSNGLFAITLFVENLDQSKTFYTNTLGLSLVFSDESSALYKCANTYINLLKVEGAGELVAPAQVGQQSGIRAVYTLPFEDVDGVALELQEAGVILLNGPIDRPWGIRTVSFQDPSGHTWEIANHKVGN
jgi:catechol 2,3-dioxygenase-like lactoylglutathione lyase family enzyme